VTVKSDVLCTVRKTMPIRRPNSAYRVREHLTEVEVTLLLKALKRNRHGKRDYAIGLIMFRHGLRVSECCDLRSDDIDLKASTIIVRRLKGSRDSTHYLERDEIQALRATRGDNSARYVFTSERGDKVFTQIGMSKLLKRAGDAAGLEHFHAHMIRHSPGYALANRGVDTRRLQHHLGHASITNTVKYSAMSPEPFKSEYTR
jgi:integrase